MKISRLALPGFVVLALLQLGAVVYQMADCAHFLKVGTPLEFACAANQWGHKDRLNLIIYRANIPYEGGIDEVDAFIKKGPGVGSTPTNINFYQQPKFKRYPVRFTCGPEGVGLVAAYGEHALAAKAEGILAYVRLQEYDNKTKLLNFDFPFDYFYVRDSDRDRIAQALKLNWKEVGKLDSYKGRLTVRFGEDGRWQIEDLCLDGKTVSIPANLQPPPPDKKEENPR